MKRKSKNLFSQAIRSFFVLLVWGVLGWGAWWVYSYFNETRVLKEVIERLTTDHRIAEVVVTDFKADPVSRKPLTTIKFVEFNPLGQPLAPRYFSFKGNLIQFQSLVVRFEDVFVKRGDWLKGKSIYLFWKVFLLDGPNTVEYDLTPIREIPAGYKLSSRRNIFEERIWNEFWDFVLNPEKAQNAGIKNAQVEAPGTRFVPGFLYTIRIEHHGGIRIDAARIFAKRQGEKANP